MFSLAIPVKAIRNRDFMVAAGATLSLMFILVITLATSLITLSPVSRNMIQVPVIVQSKFVDDPARLDNPGLLPFYIFSTVQAGIVQYPEGTSEDFAYTKVDATDLPPLSVRNGPPNSPPPLSKGTSIKFCRFSSCPRAKYTS